MIQNHLTSQPLSKRLKELKVPQRSEFYWQECADSTTNWSFGKTTTNYGLPVENYYSAFLSSELGEILPDEIEVNEVSYWLLIQRGFNDGWQIGYRKNGGHSLHFVKESETLAESMGLMLEYLITNGIIKL